MLKLYDIRNIIKYKKHWKDFRAENGLVLEY